MNQYLTLNDARIHYVVSGQGRPILLIHGFGEDGSVWDLQVAHLRDRYTLIVPDLPGSGQSEFMGDGSMEGLAEVIAAVWDDFLSKNSPGGHDRGVPDDPGWQAIKPVILGHSMGGYIMLALLERRPGLFAACGLIHSTAFPNTQEKIATRRKGILFIRQHGASAFIASTSPNLFSEETREQHPTLVKDFIDKFNGSPNSLVSYYEGMIQRPDRTRILTQPGLPVLIILGKYDQAVPLADGLRLSIFPDLAYIHVLTHSAHMGMLEEAKKTNDILDHFLSER